MRERIPFENRMTKVETILGWIYFPVHLFLLPLLLGLYAAVAPAPVSATAANFAYFGAGAAFVLCALFRFLRSGFDELLDHPGRCVVTMLLTMALAYALNLAVMLVLLLFGDTPDNPNNEQVLALAGTDYGPVKALVVFLGPIVEETLFRGVVFGSIRGRSRFWAYAVSALLFCLYHVWQYALAYADPAVLLYALQYIPVSLALAWCYERTGSIWPPIFFHMAYNALAFSVLRAF